MGTQLKISLENFLVQSQGGRRVKEGAGRLLTGAGKLLIGVGDTGHGRRLRTLARARHQVRCKWVALWRCWMSAVSRFLHGHMRTSSAATGTGECHVDVHERAVRPFVRGRVRQVPCGCTSGRSSGALRGVCGKRHADVPERFACSVRDLW